MEYENFHSPEAVKAEQNINEEELRISLDLVITKDLIMEILSHGENVKVIKPKSLIRDIKNQLDKTSNYYK